MFNYICGMPKDVSTEYKIKEAARNIFLKKGYSGAKTRDIAEEAGINLALLNYYFRSKEKLFKQIMMESLSGFFHQIFKIFDDSTSSLDDKFEQIAIVYIDQIKAQPDIPLFILSELRTHPKEFVNHLSQGVKIHDLIIINQIKSELKIEISPFHILINLLSLTVFPFIAQPMMVLLGNLKKNGFEKMMEDRKKLIPIWMRQMILIKPESYVV